MRIPESWLRAYANPAMSSEALADALTMAGLEVEETERAAPPFHGVVVGQILETEPHPNANRLRVCRVAVGGDQVRQIVCGAPNAAPGLIVPCALVGAELPGGVAIRDAELRGVASQGMLCSAKELGLSDDAGGLLVLADDAPVGLDLRQYLDLDDVIYTLKLTPNRADCLSVFGVAREVAALTGAPLQIPTARAVAVTIADRLAVNVQSADLCGRFAGRVIRGVNAAAKTPAWMRARLERAGQRSVSALVDISNYVMLELGRPTHVFDLDKIQGGLSVRWAQDGEALALLNGQTVSLNSSYGVIADEQGLESLAGIMGGDHTAVSDSTQNIYLEAAFWWPDAIRGRARNLNFSTDAAHRFERGVDAESIPEHIEYLSHLILSICGGQAGPLDDQILALPQRATVTMRLARCQRVLGVPVAATAVCQAFNRLGFEYQVNEVDGDTHYRVQPPAYRFDLELEEDLIEEVARMVGFENIPDDPAMTQALLRVQPEAQRSAMSLRDQLAAAGFFEVLTFGFVDQKLQERLVPHLGEAIRVLNPIASQLSVMRQSLLPGLVSVLRDNLARQATSARLFEIGRVFTRDASVTDGPFTVAGVHQPMRVGALAWGSVSEHWSSKTRTVDFYDLKGDLERLCTGMTLRFEPTENPALHPGRGADVWFEARRVGWVGVLHPEIVQSLGLASAPVAFELDAELLMRREVPRFEPISKFPAIVRDLAVVVGESVPAAAVLASAQDGLADGSTSVVQDVRLFDVYRGQGIDLKEKSLAFRVTLQDTDKTLSDVDADSVVAAILSRLGTEFGARLRS